jgi:hypothetical protein
VAPGFFSPLFFYATFFPYGCSKKKHALLDILIGNAAFPCCYWSSFFSFEKMMPSFTKEIAATRRRASPLLAFVSVHVFSSFLFA